MDLVHRIVSKVSLPIKSSTTSGLCSACCQAKAHSLPYYPTNHTSSAPLELVFADVWGPAPMLSRGGFRYYISFVDVFSRYTWMFPLKCKSDVVNVFLSFKRHVETLLNFKIRSLQSDWGGEFRSLRKILEQFGISHRTSCPYAHSQNGLVERKHRHIVETGLALLSHSSLPHRYWSDAFNTAVYLINKLPTPTLNHKSPHEILFKKTPNYLFLKKFGCLCWPNLRPFNKHKLNFRSLPCVFLGYSSSHHGYLCFHMNTGRMYISRDVLFDENNFPFSKSSIKINELPGLLPTPQNTATLPFFSPQNSRPNIPTPAQRLSPNSTLIISCNPNHTPNIPPTSAHTLDSSPITSINNDPVQYSPTLQHNLDRSTTSPPPQTHRESPSPTHTDAAPIHPMTTRSRANNPRPLLRTDGTIPWPPPKALTVSTSIPEDPSTVTQASKYPEWRLAMQHEFDALMTTRTWTLVPPSSNQNLVGCRWIFRTKYRPDGSIERRKARLVAKGFNQLHGLDYIETFSPVIKPTSIRLVLSIAISLGWNISQLDVQNAFLHGTLNEVVYMVQPPGFEHPDYPNYVCKLNRALYGLKQAPRAWYARLSSRLFELGFVVSKSDFSLFIYNHKYVTLYLLVYVDDIVFTGSCSKTMAAIIKTLRTDFPIKNLGSIHYFLGLECHRDSSGLLLCQRKYVLDLLKRANMLNCKPVNSPMAPSTRLSAYDSTSFENLTLYRSIVGSLQYLLFTRPDLAFSVNRVCQFMHAPCISHWQSVKRILRYLKHTLDYGLLLRPTPRLTLAAFSDADWASSPDDRKSTGGYCIFFGKNLISWSSKKQRTIARSSTEAEYKSLAHATCELIWVKSLLTELGIPLHTPPVLFCDNLGATYLSKNPIQHTRTKHVDIDFHFVRERIQAKALQVSFVSSKDQLADILTKPLSTPRFSALRTSLTVLPGCFGSPGHIKDISPT
ncbi:hypothetical protein ACJIZ3_006327 [Penstemon smallii]|uniref:Integrase catalytic domain-containing protein n=1 Tax=Penstemon smallii TaxID=265156 RepID=A0ABD3S7H9_9LAMI